MVVQARVRDAGAWADEAGGLEVAGGAEAGLEEDPGDADHRLGPRLQRRVEGDRLRAGVLHVDLQVVLQVLADAQQVVHAGNALLLKKDGRDTCWERGGQTVYISGLAESFKNKTKYI